MKNLELVKVEYDISSDLDALYELTEKEIATYPDFEDWLKKESEKI